MIQKSHSALWRDFAAIRTSEPLKTRLSSNFWKIAPLTAFARQAKGNATNAAA